MSNIQPAVYHLKSLIYNHVLYDWKGLLGVGSPRILKLCAILIYGKNNVLRLSQVRSVWPLLFLHIFLSFTMFI